MGGTAHTQAGRPLSRTGMMHGEHLTLWAVQHERCTAFVSGFLTFIQDGSKWLMELFDVYTNYFFGSQLTKN